MAFTEFRRGTVCFSFCVSLSQLKLSRDTRWKKRRRGHHQQRHGYVIFSFLAFNLDVSMCVPSALQTHCRLLLLFFLLVFLSFVL